MGHCQQLTVFRRIAIGEDPRIAGQGVPCADQSRFLCTHALPALVETCKPPSALLKSRANEIHPMLHGPMLEVHVQPARHDDHRVAPGFVPRDSVHCLWTQCAGQEALRESHAVGLQFVYRHAPEPEQTDGCPNGAAGHDARLVTEDQGRSITLPSSKRWGRTATCMKSGMVSRSVMVPSKSKRARSMCRVVLSGVTRKLSRAVKRPRLRRIVGTTCDPADLCH